MLEALRTAFADRYRIERELGQGGMATVYLAQDIKHDRKVALKVLRPELAAMLGAERFLQEIKTTAALQHPHILPLFDSGTAGTFLYYVMPYIEGETLRTLLDRQTQLGIEEAVRIATEVADALDHAHRQGVIHRDIKPENILLGDGRPIVADFGIALAVSAAAGGRMTETGLSLGTPNYMSPEQATADKDITARSDIYSLGSVLYEMLTGQPPHLGSSAQAIIMKIVTEDAAPVTRLRKSVPPNVAAAVTKALEKLPADRFESAKAFARALADPAFTASAAAHGDALAGGGARWRARAIGLGVAAAALLAAAIAGWMRPTPAADGAVIRFHEVLPFPAATAEFDVSRDGRMMVFRSATVQLYLRRLDEAGFVSLDQQGASPRFAPDGRSILVQGASGELRIIPTRGGKPRTLVQAKDQGTGMVWGDDDYIYFELASGGALGRILPAGGVVDTLPITFPDGVAASSRARYRPEVALPGGRGLVFARLDPGLGASLWLLDLRDRSKPSVPLGPDPGARKVAYSETGHLLIAQDRFLTAQALDLERLEAVGAAVPVAEVAAGNMQFAFGGGTLVYTAEAGGGLDRLAIADRRGRRRELPGLADRSVNSPVVSPDGRRIAMTVRAARGGGGSDIWVYEMPAGPLTRMTFDGGARSPQWTRDGTSLVFIENGNAYRLRADGTSEPELILDRPVDIGGLAIAPDGRRLYFQESPGKWDIGVAHLGVSGSDSLLLDGAAWEGHPAVSHDGGWLAYYSVDSERPEIFIRSLDGRARRRQISTESGLMPRWSPDRNTLYYVQQGQLLVAATLQGEDLRVARVDSLFEQSQSPFDVFPGDSLFAILVNPVQHQTGDISVSVVLHFDTELGRLVGNRAGR